MKIVKVIVKVYLSGVISEAMFIQCVCPEDEDVVRDVLVTHLTSSHVFAVGLPEADIWVGLFQLPEQQVMLHQ